MQQKQRIKLHTFVNSCNIGSRRQCEEFIRNGYIFVNSDMICKPETLIDPSTDKVFFHEKEIHPITNRYYVLLNKPLRVVTTRSDPQKRKTVMDFIPPHFPVFPVGRLDYLSEGAILLTNDGDFSQRITDPRHHVSKTYLVRVKGIPSMDVIKRLRKGIFMDGYRAKPSFIKLLSKNRESSLYKVILEEGKNRQIRNMFFYMQHPVLSLKRTAIGNISLGNLNPGEYRLLKRSEIDRLLVYQSPELSNIKK